MPYACRQCGEQIERNVWEGDWRFAWTNELCGYDDCMNVPLSEEDFKRLFPMHEKRFRIEKERGTECPVCHSWPEMGWLPGSEQRICYVCKYKEDVT